MRHRAITLVSGLLLGLAVTSVAQNAVTTVAGGGPNNVTARSASLWAPAGLALDRSGNLYVAAPDSYRVFKITRAGVLTVLAGNGVYDLDNSSVAATSTPLYAPESVAVDSSGNIYFTNVLRELFVGAVLEKVDGSTGILTDALGNFEYGDFNYGEFVYIDASDNAFLVEPTKCDVLQVDLTEQTSTVVAGVTGSCGYSGDGKVATRALLNAPASIYVDASGNMYIADTGNNVIRKVNGTSKVISTIAGNGKAGYSGDGGAPTSAELSAPEGVFLDGAGDLLITDTGNHVVRKVSGGKIATIAGNGKAGYTGDGGSPTTAELNGPAFLMLDGSQNLYISDAQSNVIRELVKQTGDIQTFAGNGLGHYCGDGGAATRAQLDDPSGVSADSFGNLFIADTSNNVVREVAAATGKITTVAGTGTEGYSGDGGKATQAQLSVPYSVFADANGNVFIADTGNHVVREVQAATGEIVTVAGSGVRGYNGDGGQATSAELDSPAGVFVDRSGNLFIADANNNAIREVSARTGAITTVAGNGTFGYSGDNGLATSASLMFPMGVYVDASGSIFIADTDNNVIREVSASTWKISTVAGNGTCGNTGDGGQATAAEICAPSGVFVDGGGNIFFTLPQNNYTETGNIVRKVASGTHIISTVAGNPTVAGFQDSSKAANALFDDPIGLTGDKSGNLYLADLMTGRIRKIAGVQVSDITPPAPAPTFSPAAGVYPSAQTVTLRDAASGATIYYSTGSTPPTTASNKYTAPLDISSTTTISAAATASGEQLSPVSQATYTIVSTAPAPAFSPQPGTFTSAQSVSLTTHVVGATIHYTTDGSTPTSTSPVYSAPITVSATTTIKAAALASGFHSATVGVGKYTIETAVPPPSFSPPPRGYWTAQSVTLNASTSGAKIYYTLNGSTPTSGSTKYGGAIAVTNSTTIKAIAVAGGVSSTVATGVYAIDTRRLLEQRVLAQEGLAMGLATQTFISQIALSQDTLIYSPSPGKCVDLDATMFSLSSSGHIGGLIVDSMSDYEDRNLIGPGFGTAYYDSACTKKWAKAELSNPVLVLGYNSGGYTLAGSTDETATFYDLAGSESGTMTLTEAINVALLNAGAQASTRGLALFTPKSGAPPAQLALACALNLAEFQEGVPALCNGGVAQDFPVLDLALGVTLPLYFTPVLNPGIAWTGSQYIGVSAGGDLFTSVSGTTWTARTSGTANTLRAVAASADVVVAVGVSGTILRSTNQGSTWAAVTSGTTGNLTSVVWTGTQFVVVGGSGGTAGIILTSPDGTTWTSHSTAVASVPLASVTWSSTLSRLVAVGVDSSSASAILTSTDGIKWTAATLNDEYSTAGLENVIWTGTQFVAVGDAAYNLVPMVAISADGLTWQAGYLHGIDSIPVSDVNLYGVAWSPQRNLYVAVGSNGTILSSPDAKTWTISTSHTTQNLTGVTWSGSQFLAVGVANIVLTSPDGVAWTVRTSAPHYGEMVRFHSDSSAVVSGALGALQMSVSSGGSATIAGGTPYGSLVLSGYAGDMAVFSPAPTAWTLTDASNGQQLRVALNNSTAHACTGTIIATATGDTLATFSVDPGGNGSITYSDGTTAAIANWVLAD